MSGQTSVTPRPPGLRNLFVSLFLQAANGRTPGIESPRLICRDLTSSIEITNSAHETGQKPFGRSARVFQSSFRELFVIIFIASLWSSVAQADAAPSIQHYRHLMFRETPYASYRGIHPIGASLANEVAHYEFSYDAEGRVVRIAYKIGDSLIERNGVWDTFIWFAPEIRIAYLNDQIIHSYYDRHGERIHVHGNVYSAVFSVDGDDERIGLEFFDAAGNASESEWGIARYEWRRDDDGHVFERRYNLENTLVAMRPDLEFHEIKLEYDSDGRLSFLRNYGLEGTPTNNATGAGIDRITYDTAGNFIRWQVYDHQGHAVEGNGPNVHLGEHLYDQFGNKIGLRGFDRHGNQISFSNGTFLFRSVFDSHGNRIEQTRFDELGSQISRLKWTYSPNGTLLENVSSLTSDGNLTSSPQLGGAAMLRFIQGEDGSITTQRLDEEMAVISEAKLE